MIELTPNECRVLGVLIEKDRTTPEQYPLSLNAIVNGANQKNNRDPVISMPENEAFEALESLRAKGLVIRAELAGGRVDKYRHSTGDVLRIRASEVAILAELLLRGPQTLGELRGRASRMHPLESLDVVKDLLRTMMERDQPLVKLLPPSPGSRAERYAQLLCPDLHPADVLPAGAATMPADASHSPSLLGRVEALEAEVEQLKQGLRQLAQATGQPDPIA
jgi:uncharacterized protein YceH (UPF0502 family)